MFEARSRLRALENYHVTVILKTGTARLRWLILIDRHQTSKRRRREEKQGRSLIVAWAALLRVLCDTNVAGYNCCVLAAEWAAHHSYQLLRMDTILLMPIDSQKAEYGYPL